MLYDWVGKEQSESASRIFRVMVVSYEYTLKSVAKNFKTHISGQVLILIPKFHSRAIDLT